jgi:zinc protease
VFTKLSRLLKRPLLAALVLLFGCAALAPAAAALELQTWQTDNGARVLFYPTANLPMVDARVIFDAGSARDGEQAGVARLTAALLFEGAGELGGQEIANVLEGTGAEFAAGATLEATTVRLRSLSDPERLGPAASLVAEVIQNPDFAPAAFERQKQRQLLSIRAKEQSPSALAADALRAAAFGDHPYGRPGTGTTASVNALTRTAVQDFHRRHYTAANAWVVLVGDLKRAEAEDLAGKLVGGLPAGEGMAPLPPPPPLEGSRVVRVPFPSEQATVQMAYNGVERRDPDYYPLFVGNHILGGSGFASRLMTNLREQRGLAYSVSSRLVPLRSGGLLVMGIQTRDDQVDQAVALMQADLIQFIQAGPTEAELADHQANIIGGFPLRLDSNAKIAENIGDLAVMGLPADYFAHYPAKIAALNPEAVQQAFRARIDPGAHVVVIVGPEAKE